MMTRFALSICAAGLFGMAAAAQEQPPAAQATSVADQTDVAVTVYNEVGALVREQRSVDLPTGQVSLKFEDVAEQIRPETVSLKSLSAPGALRILEQNYEYDLMSPDKLMEKYVGRTVRLINKDKEYDFYEVEAKLLSLNQGPVYEVDGDIYLGHPGTVVLPEIPEELIARPSLIWLLNNQDTEHDIEVTYLTGGVSWKADYVLNLARNKNFMDVEGWVTLDNQSGATYRNARLKFVAGEVHQAPQRERAQMRAAAYAQAKAAPVQEEAFAEYHLYTMPRRTTIKQNQSKQLSLLGAEGAAFEKKYEVRGSTGYYFSNRAGAAKQDVRVFILFQNEEENNLGMPLPAGVMRMYQADSSGMAQFVGEDRIGHTPKDEEVKLQMGTAFDVVAERKQIDYERVANNVHESAFEITLRNHKETGVVVDIIEPMQGDWEILESSMKYEKKNVNTIVFHAPVEAGGETVVTYRVRVKQ